RETRGHAPNTPPAQAGRCSVLRRSLRHGSPKALPEPFYVPGGVVVTVQACSAIRAGVPADRQAFGDDDATARARLVVEAGGTATTVCSAHAALALRMLKKLLHPASEIDSWRGGGS